MKEPRIVVLGGGTGSFTILQGVKQLTPNVTAIVNMSDDGGSTGDLRDEYGVLPPGDARQCLVALSDTPEVRNLFSYRFASGAMQGHTVGNVILTALEMQHGSFAEAVRVASDILRLTGRVVPVTLEKHTLVAEDSGKTYRGQHVVDTIGLTPEATLTLDPPAQLNPEAEDAIMSADMVVIAPGSIHGSLIPVLLVGGISFALRATKAQVVCLANLVNKPLQTKGWHVVDYVQQLERYTGEGVIDTVLYNTEPISDDLLSRYAEEGEYPVNVDEDQFANLSVRAVGARLVSKEVSARQQGDRITRTLIRHDAVRVKEELGKLLATK